jgi:hypothetical protein
LLLFLLTVLASFDSIFTLLPIPACRNHLKIFESQATAKIHEMGFDGMGQAASHELIPVDIRWGN